MDPLAPPLLALDSVLLLDWSAWDAPPANKSIPPTISMYAHACRILMEILLQLKMGSPYSHGAKYRPLWNDGWIVEIHKIFRNVPKQH